MKRLLAVTALAMAFAFSPVVRADTFNFAFTGNDISASGTMDATAIGGGVYNINSFSGVFTDTNSGLNVVNAPITLLPDNGSPTMQASIDGSGLGYVSPDGSEIYDNLLYAPGAPLSLDSWGGMLFFADGLEVSIAAEGDAYNGWVSVLGQKNDFVDNGTTGEVLNGGATATPEPSSLLLLGTGLFGMARLLSRKARKASSQPCLTASF